MTVALYKWSIEEWHELVDSGVLAGKKVELLEGDIVKMSPEGIEHSGTNRSVADYLRELLRGIAYISEAHPVILDNSSNLDSSEPEPDIAILRLPETVYLQHHPYAEDIYWLIEISNRTLKKDLKQKAKVYAANSIQEYWVIDLKNHKVIVHTQPDNDCYQKVEEYIAGVIKPVAFRDIEVELDRLLLYR
jgi:Uma2 family endonuclease